MGDQDHYFNSPSGKHYLDIDLPPNWFRYYTEDNEEYFFNELTGETTWDKPVSHDEKNEADSNKVELSVAHMSVNLESHETRDQVEDHSDINKSELIDHVGSSVAQPEPAVRVAEPVREAEIPVQVAVEIDEPQHEIPSNNDKVAGTRSPLVPQPATESVNPYYTAPPIISQEQIRNHHSAVNSTNETKNPFGGVSNDSKNPFGEDHSNSDNSFGKPASLEKKASANPFDVDHPDNSNPFGKPAPLEKKASANPFDEDHSNNANPFGKSTPLEKKASFNPFDKEESIPVNTVPAPNRQITPVQAAPPQAPQPPARRPPAPVVNMASYTYAPPPPPNSGAVKKQHNPFLNDSPEPRFHQPHHNVAQPTYHRPSPLVEAALHGQFSANPPIEVQAQPAPAPAPVPTPLGAVGKQPSSLLLALKAEKAQQAPVTNTPNSQPRPPPPSRRPTGELPVANPVEEIPGPLYRLLQYGIKQQIATSTLKDSGYNSKLAMQSIHKLMATSLRTNQYASQINIFKPRLVTRIKSWLPNHLDPSQNDFHTKYVCTISYDLVKKPSIASWQIEFRYSQIKDVWQIVQNHLSELSDIVPFHEPFPLATISHGLFGITDEIRNERMNKFDLWLRELITHPLAMTIWEIAESVYHFLEVAKHVRE